jgi:hypothetical protein
MCLTYEARLTPEYCFAYPYVAAARSAMYKSKITKRLTKGVIDTCGVVANTLGCPLSDEDASGIFYQLGDLLGVCYLKNQVFGRVLVAKNHGFFDCPDCECKRMLNSATDNVYTR